MIGWSGTEPLYNDLPISSFRSKKVVFIESDCKRSDCTWKHNIGMEF